MINSMTGFGRGEVSKDRTTITTEIRSVNNRFCEVSLKLPQQIQNLENEVREYIQRNVSRGKLHVMIRIDEPVEATAKLHFDRDTAQQYISMLEELRYMLRIEEPLNLDHVLSNPNIFKLADDQLERIDRLRPLIIKSVANAIEELKKMRMQEGSHLKADFDKRLDTIDSVVKVIADYAKERVPEARAKMHERVSALLESDSFDKDRLELEIAILADKLDITEELVRLESHTHFFREAMNNDESVGRKLNFLIQEMHREINTIGSKASHSGISHHVVDLKESLEIIREQVQNIE
ncbi:MAG: YicC family protein [Balneolales bacterium]|nr:YicC family protein [Balneolales bacterium]